MSRGGCPMHCSVFVSGDLSPMSAQKSGLGLSRCIGPGECLHSFIHTTGNALCEEACMRACVLTEGIQGGCRPQPGLASVLVVTGYVSV